MDARDPFGLGDRATKLMYGDRAVHVPMWMYVQDMGKGGVAFVGASRSTQPRYGCDETHQFILGEVIIRPHLIMSSNAFVGHGLNCLAKANHTDLLDDPSTKLIYDMRARR